MFAAIIMVCGLNMQHPQIVDTCGLGYHEKPFRTEEECNQFHLDGLPGMQRNMPDGAYVADVQCVELSGGDPKPNL